MDGCTPDGDEIAGGSSSSLNDIIPIDRPKQEAPGNTRLNSEMQY